MAFGMPVKKFLRKHTSREIAELMAFDRVNPQGEWRADLRNALLISTLVNLWKDAKSPRTKLDDYLIDFAKAASGEAGQPMTQEQQIAAVRLLNKLLGGTELPRNGNNRQAGG